MMAMPRNARESEAVLRAAFPGAELDIEPPRSDNREPEARARIIFKDSGESVQWAYLEPTDDGGAMLTLYVADTLEQARRLYPRKFGRLSGLRELASHGWELTPNFHFGYREAGFVWSDSKVGLDEYISHWVSEIEVRRKAPKRAEWARYIDELIAKGIFDPGGPRAAFEQVFVNSRRPYAAPRPGIRVRFVFGAEGAAELPRLVERRLREVLTALHETKALASVSP